MADDKFIDGEFEEVPTSNNSLGPVIDINNNSKSSESNKNNPAAGRS